MASRFERALERHVPLWVLLGCALSLAYLYLLAHGWLASRGFSSIFRFLLWGHDRRAAAVGLLVCLAALAWRRPTAALRLVDAVAAHPVRAIAAAAAVMAAGALVVYHAYPLSMDEYAAVFQSKIFAAGAITARLPPHLVDWLIVPGFNGQFILASHATGRAIETYWPGFALLLTPFERLGAPWLCNPLLAAAALYLIHRITVEITGDRRAAAFALMFAIASGAFFANAVSLYSMQAHLTADLLFVWLLLRPSAGRAFAAGVVGSFALVLHNPVPHTLFALPWLLSMVFDRERRRWLAPLIAGYLPLSLSLGLGWMALRHSIEADAGPVAVLGDTVRLAFGWPDAVLLNMRAAALAKMWVWAVPGLFLFAWLGFLRHRRDRAVRLMAQSALLTFAGYLFVHFDQGHGWGFRYFHSAWGVVPVLAACALTDLDESRRRLVSFAAAVSLLSLVVLVPFQAHQVEGFIAEHLAQLPPMRRPGNDVVFVRVDRGYYQADMIQIDPFLRDQDLLLVSHGAAADEQFVHDRWPGARLLRGARPVSQWYLGDADQRVPDPSTGVRRFVLDGGPLTPPR